MKADVYVWLYALLVVHAMMPKKKKEVNLYISMARKRGQGPEFHKWQQDHPPSQTLFAWSNNLL